MFRYLPGLLLLQLVTLALFLLNEGADPVTLLLRVGVPTFALSLVTALWFRSLSRADGERDLARTRLEHEREREDERERLRRDAARERETLARESERAHRREVRRTSRRAAFQVGLAFAATGGMGVLFVLSELVTLGLLTLATTVGALGGYSLRWRQTRSRMRPRGPEPLPPDATFETGTIVTPDAVPRLSAPADETPHAKRSSWRARL